jgi:pyrroline-5-carboxylate reductase
MGKTQNSLIRQRIGLIGAGQMAAALAAGFVKAGLVQAKGLLGSDPQSDARARFGQTTGCRTTADNLQVVKESDVVFLAVKPQQIAQVACELKGKITAEKLVISIAAGIRLATLADLLGAGTRLVRVMPNTPCLVGQGACAFSLGEKATAEDGELVRQLLAAVGIACQVDERLLDAVTGLSGSGPAFVYLIIEALSDGGVRMGLPRNIAAMLAMQTVRGTAEMVASTGEHPAVLKDRVASPGGTTIAGLQVLEDRGLRAALIAAVEAAARRSMELGNIT